jgi:hypothetical protein
MMRVHRFGYVGRNQTQGATATPLERKKTITRWFPKVIAFCVKVASHKQNDCGDCQDINLNEFLYKFHLVVV